VKNFIAILICVLISVFAAAKNRNNSLLQELDKTIAQKQQFFAQKEVDLQKIKEQVAAKKNDQERYFLYGKLFDGYKQLNNDSCLFYAEKKREYANKLQNPYFQVDATMNYADILMLVAMYKEALDSLNVINTKQLPDYLFPYYYHLYNTIYRSMESYAATPNEKKFYTEIANRYRDSLLNVQNKAEAVYLLIESDNMIDNKEYEPALKILQSYLDTLPPESHELGMFAYSIAHIYQQIGNIDEAVYYYALSSIADLKSGIREYASLPRLAVLMMQKGDIDRAYRYLNCSMEDASESKSRLRTIEMSQIFQIVNNAYQQKEKKQQHTMTAFLLLLIAAIVSLVIGIIYIYRQIKKVQAARRALKIANRQLSEANRIKEKYLGQYMDFCTEYIDCMDKFRSTVLKIAQNGNQEKLLKTLKSKQFLEDKLSEFYKNFDNTFLSIFPNFIMEFNELLSEPFLPKKEEEMSVELRIFALIRLGITDSRKIAQFLHYSLATIFNYRSRIRNKALGKPEQFEQKVMEIGQR
jgi:hypothetical protein